MLSLGRGGRREGIPYSSTPSTAPRTRLPLRDLLLFCPHYCVVTYSRAKLRVCSTTIICWQYFIPIFCRNKLTRSKAVRSRRIIFQYAQWGYLLMDFDMLDYQSIKKWIWKWWLPTIISPCCHEDIMPAYIRTLAKTQSWDHFSQALHQQKQYKIRTLAADIKADCAQPAGPWALCSKGPKFEGSQPPSLLLLGRGLGRFLACITVSSCSHHLLWRQDMKNCDTAEKIQIFPVHLPASPFSPSQVSSSSRLPVPPCSPPPGNTFPCNVLQPLSPLPSLTCHDSRLSRGLCCSSQRFWSPPLTHRAVGSGQVSVSLETLRDGNDRGKEVQKMVVPSPHWGALAAPLVITRNGRQAEQEKTGKSWLITKSW